MLQKGDRRWESDCDAWGDVKGVDRGGIFESGRRLNIEVSFGLYRNTGEDVVRQMHLRKSPML